jgi:hypothetical protein
MKKSLTSLSLIFALAGGVLAGMPLHSGNMNSQMMDCCDKAKSKEQSPAADAARLCCAVNCSSPTPTSSPGSFNFTPSNIEISKSIADQISALFVSEKSEPAASIGYSPDIRPRIFQPKYIQNNSFLI